jgi:hypothetical protein
MRTAITGDMRSFDEPFARSVPLVRRLLLDAGLRIVTEIEVSNGPDYHYGLATHSCVVLLVDTPVLLFEAIALDRGAAVFVPVHVVVGGDHGSSYVHWANPIATSGLRPPVSARRPLENLYACVTRALADL